MGKGILSIIIIFCLNFVLCLLAFTLTFILPRVDEKERKHNKKGQEEKQEEKQENKKRSKDKREHSREGAKRTSLLFCLVVFTHKILREQQPITSTIYQTCTCMTRETWIRRREKREESRDACFHGFMGHLGTRKQCYHAIPCYATKKNAMQRKEGGNQEEKNWEQKHQDKTWREGKSRGHHESS